MTEKTTPTNGAATNGQAKSGHPKLKGAPATLGQTFGEMVWLLTQSPIHKQLKIADIEWLLMPAIILGQARVFKAGDQALGMAMWAYLTPEDAAELNKAGKLDPAKWRHGTDIKEVIANQFTERSGVDARAKRTVNAGKPVDLTPPTLKEGELELWLVDLVCPFATKDNKLVEACLHDLITGPLKGMPLNMQRTDPKTGEKSVITLGGEE